MNKQNLQKLRYYGVEPQLIAGGAPGGRDQITIMLGTRPFGMMGPPQWTDVDKFTRETEAAADPAARFFEEKFASSLMAARAMMATAKLGNAFAKASKDKRLTFEGQRDAVNPDGEAAIRELSAQAADLLRERQRLVALDAELFERSLDVPKEDVQTVLLDVEIRAHVARTASAESSAAELMGLISSPRVTEALARSPVPLPDWAISHVRDRWRAIMTERAPERVAELQAGMEYCDWADHVLRTLAQVTREMLALTARDAWRIARSAGGGYIFADEASVRVFELTERGQSAAA